MTPTPETQGKYLPCLNPHCKSHGKPHPNCRCYGSGAMSEGGEVGGFCCEPREHNHDCEYYAGGGKVQSWDSLSTEPPQDVSGWDSLSKSPPKTAGGWDSLTAEPPSENKNPNDWLETAKAGAEGLSQGVLGPLAPMAEVGLGISTKENIAKRAEEHPIAHGVGETAGLVGGLLAGTGEAGLIAKGAGMASEAAELGKVGSSVLKAAIEGASFTASDEMTKAFLGQPGSDPEHPVSAALLHVGAGGLMGGLAGGAFSLGEGMIGRGLESINGTEAKAKTQEFLIKLAKSDDPLKDLGLSQKISHAMSKTIAWPIAAKTGTGQIGYEAIEEALSRPLNKILGKVTPSAKAAFLKAAMLNEASGVPNAIHFANQAGRGAKMALSGVGALFKAGSSQLAPKTSDYEKNKLKEFIEGGQVEKQMQNSMGEQGQPANFAHGGEVKSEPNDHFARVFPEQNTLLNAAKGRISTYLNSVRPLSHQPKPAFDDAPKNTEQHRQYNKAVDLAVNPMSILDHMNKGDLTPENLKHFVGLYPEVHRFLSKEITKKITESQLAGEKPPYGKRQAMSLFLGADLDSSFSPVAIQTVQSLYANKQAQQSQQVPTKNKKGTSSLSKSSNHSLTDDQAREQRQQNQKT